MWGRGGGGGGGGGGGEGGVVGGGGGADGRVGGKRYWYLNVTHMHTFGTISWALILTRTHIFYI